MQAKLGAAVSEALRAKTRSPKPYALEAARGAAKHAKPTAPVRWRFLERAEEADPAPPMARILRGDRDGKRGGGRGGEVRLKLLLSMLWMVRDTPALPVPSRAWAALLGLDDPTGKGVRRINDAIKWLDEAGFVGIEQGPGGNRLVSLFEESGTGRAYQLPGAAIRAIVPQQTARRAQHFYLQLPSTLWTNGWISMLSGAGTAMLLLLHRLQASNTDDTQLWLAPADAKTRFDLSDDTRSKGLRELTMAGLVTMERRPVDPFAFTPERVRNVYLLRRDRFARRARILTDYDDAEWWDAAAAATGA